VKYQQRTKAQFGNLYPRETIIEVTMKNIIGLSMVCALFMAPIVAADKEQEKKKQKLDENEQVIEEPKKKRIYKWTDEHGKVHYSDTPRKDAESMDIREINSVQSVVSETGKKLINPVKESEFEPERPVFRYKQFAIETPKDDEAVRSNDGVIQVVLKIEPDLRDRDRIKAYVDGEVREEKITSRTRTFNSRKYWN